MEKALSHITVLPSTKREREVFVNKAIEEIANGEQNPLRIEIQLKNMEETISMIRKSSLVKDIIRREADKYPGKTFETFGAIITKVETTKWDYSTTGDTVLVDYQNQMELLKAAIKDREKWLQALKPGMIAVDEVTGQVLAPPRTTVEETLRIVIQ